MQPASEIPDLSSQQAMQKDLNEMVNINCTKSDHNNEGLNKLCEDEECNEQTE